LSPSRLVVGVDASRNRSGGARAHLIGILTEGNPTHHGIDKVHVWAYRSLLDALPDRRWLVKHNPPALEQSFLRQVWWQRFQFHKELQEANCSIVLNTDAGTVGVFRPAVTMSRDMLSYEPGEIERFGVSKMRLRLIALRHLQNRSLRVADGAIFLTRHAGRLIQQSCGALRTVAFIPHGVGEDFKRTRPLEPWPERGSRPIRCLYVSPIWLIKHQWVVVRAIDALRKRGHDVTITLIGAGGGKAQRLLDEQLAISDPQRSFVQQVGFVPHHELARHMATADICVFASSCENMPNTLVEAMAVGLPIACSNRGPMPEVLEDAGVYFDPEDDVSIASAIERIITSDKLRLDIAKRALTLSNKYSWSRCSAETWSFVANVHRSR